MEGRSINLNLARLFKKLRRSLHADQIYSKLNSMPKTRKVKQKKKSHNKSARMLECILLFSVI